MSDRTWSIGELAAEFDTTLRTIRFYEDRGLLTPERHGTARIFHDRDRVRLQLILRGKRLGFTLDEIAHVIDMYDETPGERGQLEFLIADIDQRRTLCWPSGGTWTRRWPSWMSWRSAAEPISRGSANLAEGWVRRRTDLITPGPARRPRPAGRSRPTGGGSTSCRKYCSKVATVNSAPSDRRPPARTDPA